MNESVNTSANEPVSGRVAEPGGSRLLFVCMGNICRSPLAEGVFIHKARGRGALERFQVDSAGTHGYHEGEAYDLRSHDIARRHGVALVGRSRPVRSEDFQRFDLLLAMDADNYAILRKRAPEELRRRVRLLGEWLDPVEPPEVPDPYYGGPDGFEGVYHLIDRMCDALLDDLLSR